MKNDLINVKDDVKDRPWLKVRDTATDNVDVKVWENVWENVRENIHSNVWRNIYSNVRDNIKDNVESITPTTIQITKALKLL